MNQILSTGNNENDKREEVIEEDMNYDSNNSYDFNSLNNENLYARNSKGPNNTKKIITIFAICIAVFGIIIIGVFAVGINNGGKKENKIVDPPEIVIEEDGNYALVKITTEGELSNVSYYWNEEEDREEMDVTGSAYETSIKILNGKSTLHVEATDVNDKTSENSKKFTRNYDEKEPIIKATPYGTGKIKIVATDETSMDYITYKWEDEEEEIIQEVENEGDKEITVIIDAKREINKLYITAVDTSENEAVSTPNFQGALKPTIDVKKTKSGKLKVKVAHDKGFKKVQIYFNGEIETYDENSEDYDETKTLIEKVYNLQEGENEIAVIATSLEWDEEHEEYTEQTYVADALYEPDSE